MSAVRTVVLGAAFILAASPAALAAHGKAGTWEVTTTMSGGGMGAMPDMSKLPPEVRARMQAHGVQMNGGGMTAKFCMTADQVANDKPPMTHHGNCEAQNMKVKGNTFSADVVCKGHMNGKGHVEVTYDTPEHYTGHQTITMTMDGQQMTHDMTMEGHWLSADCKIPAAKPGQPTP